MKSVLQGEQQPPLAVCLVSEALMLQQLSQAVPLQVEHLQAEQLQAVTSSLPGVVDVE